MAVLSAEQVYAAARDAGATHGEAITMVALARGESGFQHDARNPNASTGDDSWGLWQINMIGDLGRERLKQYGLTDKNQLFDVRTNARVALQILRTQGLDAWKNTVAKPDWTQWQQEAADVGFRLQNSWQDYARNLSFSRTRPGEEASGAFNGGGGAGTTTTSSTTIGPTAGAPKPGETADGRLSPSATPDQVLEFIADHYGADIAGFLDIPELRDLLVRAGQNGWTPALFNTHLRGTNWWRTNSESVRSFVALKITDPAEYEARVGAKLAELVQTIEPLGLNLGGAEGQRKWAENAIKYGWTTEQLTAKLANQLTKQSGQRGLTADSIPDVTADRLMQIARMEYLTPIDRLTAERWAIKGLRQGQGGDVEEQFRSFMTTMSAARFGVDPASGITPADMMAPVRTIIAEELELNPEAIDFLDPRYREVLQVEGKDGYRPMTMTEAGQWARSREEFKTTTKGVDASANMAEALAKTFGKVK